MKGEGNWALLSVKGGIGRAEMTAVAVMMIQGTCSHHSEHLSIVPVKTF